MTAFIGVVKAIYDYEPQTDEELALQENDLLYLLEKSDVDEWWTVKKRVIGLDAEEPTGLVPSNYVEPATPISTVKAIYDYEETQNPQEEITFHENELFDVFDDKDQDWLLVQSKTSGSYGFIPGNYVEATGGTSALPLAPPPQPFPIAAPAAPSAVAAAVPVAAPAVAPVTPTALAAQTPIAPPIISPTNPSAFPPPPQHPMRTSSASPHVAADSPKLPQRPGRDSDDEPPLPSRPRDDPSVPSRSDDMLADVPPAKPVRHTSTGGPGRDLEVKRDHSRDDEDDYGREKSDNRRMGAHGSAGRRDSYDESSSKAGYHIWSVSEVDGRKKHKCKLTVGKNKIYFESSKGGSEEWTIDKLTTYDSEKKHIFLDFVDPYRSLELHAGNNDTCAEIMTVLGEYKGAQRDPALREIEAASKPKKQGTVLFNFDAESKDELTVKQGQMVYIVNDKKSKDWWMCELVSNGKRGVVPSQFIEPVKEKGSSGGSGFFGSLRKITGNTEKFNARQANRKGRSDDAGGSSWRDDEAQSLSEASPSKRSKRRSSSVSGRKSSRSASKNEFPDPKKCRIWADRSASFKVEAQFIGFTEGKIHLHKANGVKIAVVAEKLSDEDLIYVERATGMNLSKFKSRGSGSGDMKADRDKKRGQKEQTERDHDRWSRGRELEELRKARELLEEERARLREADEQAPPKPPRPQSTGGANTVSLNYQPKYDWFEFFLNCGVDVSNCQRYTINFEREHLSEDMMKDINEQMMRTLGLREGDIVRVTKYLNEKFNREPQLPPGQGNGGMFSEPDGSLKVANPVAQAAPSLTQNLLPQNAAGGIIQGVTGAPASSAPLASAPLTAAPLAMTPLAAAPSVTAPLATAPAASGPPSNYVGQGTEDDTWTAKPAAKAEVNASSDNAEFTGSMQDLIDLRPLEPKKKEPSSAPEPNLRDLEPVKTGTENKVAPLSTATTGGPILQPMNPFKTGNNNVLPMTTGFVMVPITTGGIIPMQRTGGMFIPQTTFGAQATGGNMLPQQPNLGPLNMGLQATGNMLQPQKTNFGLIPTGTGSALQSQGTSTVLQPQRTNTMLPIGTLQPQRTNSMLPIGTGNVLQPQRTNTIFSGTATSGMMPQTTFGSQPMGAAMPMQGTGGVLPRLGSVLPIQKTGGGLMPVQGVGNTVPMQITGGAMPVQSTGGFVSLQRTGGMAAQITGNLVPLQRTGTMPQTTLGANITGNANMMPQTSFGGPSMIGGANMMPQTSFGGSQITGGANLMPQTSFGANVTGGANMMTQASFGGPPISGVPNMMPQASYGIQNVNGNVNMMPQTSFGANVTGGANMMSQPNFGGPNMTGGVNMMPQTSFEGPQTTGAFQQNSFNNAGTSMQMQTTNGLSSMVPQSSVMTGGFQQNNQLGSQNQFTGGPIQQSFPNTSFNSAVDNATQGMQNMSFSQAPLQSQPTGFGFGNGPQQSQQSQQQQPKQANLFNATADNPFGF